ncbi:MAG: multidrug transporter [Gelidibacter sp.]
MKNNLLLGIAIVSMLFSCTTDDTSDIVINDNSVTNNNNGGGTTDPQTIFLSGTYTSDLTLDANNTYKVNGSLIMASGTTLTIPAGMTIKALAAGSDVYIAISQGAKINANGTASNPIVLTSDAASPAAGDWGGLIILGKAPINSVTGNATSTSEIASLPYGGQIPSDDSGTIRYLRVEYSGGAADGQSENNGLSFYGVGSGTLVEYVESFEGKDDGFEFFGGTVNVNFLYAVNNQDDSIDWTEGYSGTITNAYVKHGADHDKALECDGYNTDFSNAAGYYSKPTVTNVTIEGFDAASGTAVNVRAGTQGLFNNFKISNFSLGFKMDGDSGDNPTGAGVLSGDLHVSDITFVNVASKLANNTPDAVTEANFISGDGNGTGTDFATWGAGWTRN